MVFGLWGGFVLRGLEPRGVLAVLLAATALGWFGAWLAASHQLRQARAGSA